MISNLIIKYLNGEASEAEISQIYDWIDRSESNKNEFIAMKKTWAMMPFLDENTQQEWEKLQLKIPKNKTFNPSHIFKYAAIIMLFVAIGSLIYNRLAPAPSVPKDIVLEIQDQNRSIKLNAKNQDLFYNSDKVIAKHTENELVYNTKTTSQPLSYHTLNIPFGKTFKVILSDSSVVYLNSGSVFKYPKQFGSHSNRNVFLQGEAYFEIKKDEKHPFTVSSESINIQVLGTKFNVNAYANNPEIACVLVEGSVKLSEVENSKNALLLTPNQKGTWLPASKTFASKSVKTTTYISWIKNELIFEAARFSEISKKLERSFDVKIDNDYPYLETQEFTGTINTKTSNIENILDLLSIDTPFEYTKVGSVIKISNTH